MGRGTHNPNLPQACLLLNRPHPARGSFSGTPQSTQGVFWRWHGLLLCSQVSPATLGQAEDGPGGQLLLARPGALAFAGDIVFQWG